MIQDIKRKNHPFCPCNECIVRAMCDIMEHFSKCQPVSDYANALVHKDPTMVCTFIINIHGVWEPLFFNGSKNCTIEDLIQGSKWAKPMYSGSVFDYDKHLEYTKYLESLEYYDLL
jgi:hypothetical protein